MFYQVWQLTLKKSRTEGEDLGSSDLELGSKNVILDRQLLDSAKSSQKIIILRIKSKGDLMLPALLPILVIL